MLRPIKDYLDQALHRTGAERSVKAATIVEAAGPLIRNVAPELRPADFEVVSYRDGTLRLAVASPVVAQELRLHSEPILDVLRDTFPSHAFQRLVFSTLVEREREF